MKIENILSGIRETQASEKTAGAPQAPASEPTKTASHIPSQAALAGALDKALESTKTASAPSGPVNDVMKVAAEIASMEKEAEYKHMQVLGAAWAEAAISKWADFQKTAEAISAPQAAEAQGFGKFASENPEMVKQAADLSYTQTRAHLEKVAADAYTQGYNDTVNQVHKLASDEFMKAAYITSQLIEAAASQGQ